MFTAVAGRQEKEKKHMSPLGDQDQNHTLFLLRSIGQSNSESLPKFKCEGTESTA